MSAVSMKFTPSSTARRTTRTPSSRSLTMRMEPKPRRRTSSSPPSMNVGFTTRPSSTLSPRAFGHRPERRREDAHAARAREREDDDVGHLLRRQHPGEHVLRAAAVVVEREIGGHAAGADARAADPLLAQLVVERANEADLTELRRVVDRFVRERPQAGHRCDREDVALAPFEQLRQRRAHRVDRAHEIDVDHLLDVRLVELEERAVGADARVCDEDVEPPERVDGVGDEAVEILPLPHVASACDRVQAEVVATAGAEPEVDAFAVQRACDGGADAAARPGDDRHLAFEHTHACDTNGMHRVLVATRGEIALRVFRACAAEGLETVAVAAPDDLGSLHARSAGTTVEIASSLVPAEHVRAALEAGADAVHPGYGFLAESA